jgi:hypothetical protein
MVITMCILNGYRHIEMRNTYKILAGEPEGNIPLGRRRRIWEDNIRMDLRVGRCELDASGSV